MILVTFQTRKIANNKNCYLFREKLINCLLVSNKNITFAVVTIKREKNGNTYIEHTKHYYSNSTAACGRK